MAAVQIGSPVSTDGRALLLAPADRRLLIVAPGLIAPDLRLKASAAGQIRLARNQTWGARQRSSIRALRLLLNMSEIMIMPARTIDRVAEFAVIELRHAAIATDNCVEHVARGFVAETMSLGQVRYCPLARWR